MDGQVFREVFSYSQRYDLKPFEKIINKEKKTICFKNKLTFDHKEGNTVYPIVMYRSEYVFLLVIIDIGLIPTIQMLRTSI